MAGVVQDLEAANAEALKRAQLPIAKAYFAGEAGGSESQVRPEQDRRSSLFDKAGALIPLYDLLSLAALFENSSCLRSDVDAYITNIDSYGQRFEPTIDLTQAEADALIRSALRIERKRAKGSGVDVTKDDEPTDAEVKARREQLEVEIAEERALLEIFFENCTVDMPFCGPEGLRGLTRQDVEVLGNGYWEVLRNGFRQVCQFNYVPGHTVRLMPIDKKPTPVDIQRRVSALSTEKVTVYKRFRRFVQCWENEVGVVYFKEFGDPRTISSRTGKVYDTPEALKATEPDAAPATELIWFKITSLRSPYGAPRWIGTLLSVMGNRQSEEVNFLYFENRSVPPLAVLVSGGHLRQDSVQRLENYVETNIKGLRNSHKILILEAEGADAQAQASGGSSARMKIEIVPLTDAQQKDALFQAYDERNTDKVGQAFRLPRLLRGDVRDFNRSTAEASIDFAEIQVFGPIRQEFDWRMNKLILPELGIKYHTFHSNAPTVRDPDALSQMIERLAKANVLTPEEARALSVGVFNKELPRIDAAWTKQPVALTLAGRGVQDDLNTPDDESVRYKTPGAEGLESFNQAGGMSAAGAGSTQAQLGVSKGDEDEHAPGRLMALQARALVKLHKHMLDAERVAVEKNWRAMEREVVKLPAAEFNALVAAEVV